MDEKVAAEIRNTRNAVFVSAVSSVEIAIKSALGKLDAPDDLEDKMMLVAEKIDPCETSLSHSTPKMFALRSLLKGIKKPLDIQLGPLLIPMLSGVTPDFIETLVIK